jgi:hypothetical protein
MLISGQRIKSGCRRTPASTCSCWGRSRIAFAEIRYRGFECNRFVLIDSIQSVQHTIFEMDCREVVVFAAVYELLQQLVGSRMVQGHRECFHLVTIGITHDRKYSICQSQQPDKDIFLDCNTFPRE